MRDSTVDADTVDAFCAGCKREVLVDHTRRCPNCEQPVDPRSLPRTELSRIVSIEQVPPAELKTGESVVLPPVFGALPWLTSTRQLRDRLAKEDAELTPRLRQVRRALKLLDQVLAMVDIDSRAPVAPSATAARATPSRVARGLRWARNYDACVRCGTTERKHLCRGFCAGCETYLKRHRVAQAEPVEQN